MKRDSDNAINGLKYLLDGLVMAGVLRDDSRARVDLQIGAVVVDRIKPRVEIKIEDEKNE